MLELQRLRGLHLSARPGRGVRLSDLDKSCEYRIAYVGRRWEVIGPLDAPDAGAGPAAGAAGGAKARGLRPTDAYVPRHAAPAATTG